MLLFTSAPAVDADFQRTNEWLDELTGIRIAGGVARGRHAVRLDAGTVSSGETVGPIVVAPVGAEPVSPLHLPPFYRWDDGGWSFEFQSSWRTTGLLVAGSRRHLRSLRRHPRAVVIEPGDVEADDVDAPVAALVVGLPRMAAGESGDGTRMTVEWRGWHVIEVDVPFVGTESHVLATHTRAVRPSGSSPPTGS